MKFTLLAGASLAALTVTVAGAKATSFGYTGSIVDYTIVESGWYDIVAFGAQGGAGYGGGEGGPATSYSGGRGAEIGGQFYFAAGTMLQLAVGGMGQSGSGSGGGGGGSFVVDAANNPLVIAGGGGGIRAGALRDGFDANTGLSGYSGSGNSYSGAGGGIATNNDGQGGAAPDNSWGSGGAGFFSNGANDYCGPGYYDGYGGASWANGLGGGGKGVCGGGGPANGGFGGGGAGYGNWGGGGGGGYSGGDGGLVAGGGGSYLSDLATNELSLSGAGYGNGYITIDEVTPATPEPATLLLFGAGAAALGAARRRRRS